MAKLITVNCTDKERLHSLFDHIRETDPPPLPFDDAVLPTPREAGCDTTEQRGTIVDLSEVNVWQGSASQKRLLLSILGKFKKIFPSGLKCVPPCSTGKLRLPIKDEGCST